MAADKRMERIEQAADWISARSGGFKPIAGMFAFYGANRTGRWAGRLIQLQNLPQNHLPDLADARALVKSGDLGISSVVSFLTA